jgi:hypothetical protein
VVLLQDPMFCCCSRGTVVATAACVEDFFAARVGVTRMPASLEGNERFD